MNDAPMTDTEKLAKELRKEWRYFFVLLVVLMGALGVYRMLERQYERTFDVSVDID